MKNGAEITFLDRYHACLSAGIMSLIVNKNLSQRAARRICHIYWKPGQRRPVSPPLTPREEALADEVLRGIPANVRCGVQMEFTDVAGFDLQIVYRARSFRF